MNTLVISPATLQVNSGLAEEAAVLEHRSCRLDGLAGVQCDLGRASLVCADRERSSFDNDRVCARAAEGRFDAVARQLGAHVNLVLTARFSARSCSRR